MKSRWMTHRGEKIFYADYSGFGLDVEALQVELEAVTQTLAQEPLASVLALSDIHGTKATPQTLVAIKNALAKNSPYMRKRVVVGLTATQRVFVEIVNKVAGKNPIIVFEDIEQAKNWLVTKP